MKGIAGLCTHRGRARACEIADDQPRPLADGAGNVPAGPGRQARATEAHPSLAYSAIRQPRYALNPIAVIDFETTGLSPAQGDRATEIAIVVREGMQVVGRFQSLMNAGVRISPFIEAYTGISNEMIRAAPPAADVMSEAARFVGGMPLVAHNAAFDQRFWVAELARLGGPPRADPSMACTLLLSRRLYPEAGSYRLGSLAAFHAIAPAGRAHRAMEVEEAPHDLLLKLQRTPRKALPKAVQRYFHSLRVR
jgi:DNA polymerase-3 subunit epsilon